MYLSDTIAAIATPPGIGGVGIIRVSGSEAFSIVNRLFTSQGPLDLRKRPNKTIQYGYIIDPDTPDRHIIDEVLLLLMKGPHSYTAEDFTTIASQWGSLGRAGRIYETSFFKWSYRFDPSRGNHRYY